MGEPRTSDGGGVTTRDPWVSGYSGSTTGTFGGRVSLCLLTLYTPGYPDDLNHRLTDRDDPTLYTPPVPVPRLDTSQTPTGTSSSLPSKNGPCVPWTLQQRVDPVTPASRLRVPLLPKVYGHHPTPRPPSVGTLRTVGPVLGRPKRRMFLSLECSCELDSIGDGR